MLRSTLLLTLIFCGARQSAWPADSYTSEIEGWRKRYDRDLLGPDGPYTFVARFVPKPGISSLGHDRTNDLVLPIEQAPAHAGKIEWPGRESATLRLEPGVEAIVDGKPVSEVQFSKPVTVTIGAMQLLLRFRELELRIAVKDTNARMRREAKPSVWFPIDQRYRITADWAPFPGIKTIRIPDNDGGSRVWKSPGHASFAVDGKNLELLGTLTPDEKQLSFFFRDNTAAHETYGAGRFLEAELPKNGKVVLDFNKAYNPSCAFNPLYICPIPPKENHLAVRIPAGELNNPHQGEAH
jgi:uncharacterized protein (DUF1684 family)